MAEYQEPSYAEVNSDVLRTMMETGPKYWMLLGTSITVAIVCFFGPWVYQLNVGVGAAGMNQSAFWGTYLGNFIFWIGLSHSGTLLSAVLHITQSSWRKAIYRSAEAMTLFSLVTAAFFVMVHVGRVWFVHWNFPIPNQMGLWPNFRSPLLFDVMAVTTYLTASSIFIYMGSVPDFAAVRDASTGMRRRLYTIFSFGWRGTAQGSGTRWVGPTHSLPSSSYRWLFRYTASCHGTSPCRLCPVCIRRFSHRILSAAQSTRARPASSP